MNRHEVPTRVAPKKKKNSNKMACVVGAKRGRGGGEGEKRDKMINKTLLRDKVD